MGRAKSREFHKPSVVHYFFCRGVRHVRTPSRETDVLTHV